MAENPLEIKVGDEMMFSVQQACLPSWSGCTGALHLLGVRSHSALGGAMALAEQDANVPQVLYSEDEGKRNELRDSLADEVKEAIEGAPMVVIGKINELCLGPRFWWE